MCRRKTLSIDWGKKSGKKSGLMKGKELKEKENAKKGKMQGDSLYSREEASHRLIKCSIIFGWSKLDIYTRLQRHISESSGLTSVDRL